MTPTHADPAAPLAENASVRGPVAASVGWPRSPGLLLGAGLGGMLDGIVLHEVLQLHSMLSNVVPLVSMEAMRVNMTADGVFHAAMWLFVVVGVVRLVHAMRDRPSGGHGRALIGDALLGWGLFNLVEGVVDHQLLQLHHVVQAAPVPLPADLLFLGFGALLVAVGRSVGARARRRAA